MISRLMFVLSSVQNTFLWLFFNEGIERIIIKLPPCDVFINEGVEIV